MGSERVQFRLAIAASLTAGAFVAVVASLLAPIGAISHLHGFVTAMCDTIPHIVSDVAALLLLALVAGSIVACIATIAASVMLERRLATEWTETAHAARGSRARRIARSAGIDAVVVVFGHPEPIACSRGIVDRTIWISDACLDRLDDQELRAVLAHEHHHCARRDPGRLQLVTICARTLLAFPLVAVLAARFRSAAEFAADDHARRIAGARATARALLKLADATPSSALAQFAEPTSIAERVQRLLDAPVQPSQAGTARATALTLVTALGSVACLLVVVALPGMT